MTSAYPTPVETIVATLRERLHTGASLPSRNQVMKEFGVGSPKATRVIEKLSTPVTDTPAPSTGPETEPVAEAAAAPEPTPVTTPEAATPETVGPEVGQSETGPGERVPAPVAVASAAVVPVEVDPVGHPVVAEAARTVPAAGSGRPRWLRWVPRQWPLLLLALPAFVAIWGGWVGLGKLAGFGHVTLLPGIADDFTIDSSITLPIGVETYAAYALAVWLNGRHTPRVTRFAMWSAIGSLVLGVAGQVAYHLMTAAGMLIAPWGITAVVASLPVLVLGCAAALAHLTHHNTEEVPA